MIHKRHFLFALEFHDGNELIAMLEEIELYARTNGHASPAIEMQTAGSAGEVRLWEETLSDKSTQLVAMLA